MPGSIAIIAFCFSGGLFAQAQGWTISPLPLTWWSGPLMLASRWCSMMRGSNWDPSPAALKPLYASMPCTTKASPRRSDEPSREPDGGLLNQAFNLILPFILPIPWQMLVLQKLYDQASGMLGHAGFEHFASPAGRTPFPFASTVFHDQHHGHFKYNYGHTFSWWDRLMGTLHPRYDATLESFEPGKVAVDPDAVRATSAARRQD